MNRVKYFTLALLLCVGMAATAQKARSNRSKPKAKPQPQKVERLKTIAVYITPMELLVIRRHMEK